MTSVGIRKKFLTCRQYKLRGVDQVDQVIIINSSSIVLF